MKLLFTPGPLTTAMVVKEAGLTDMGSRDRQFIDQVQQIRTQLVELANAPLSEYTAVIMQGSGTFGVESVISTVIPEGGKLLNIINGSYGHRISQMARIHRIPLTELVYSENQIPDLTEIEDALSGDPQITHLALVHGETTTGLLNPIRETGMLANRFGKTYIVDAMSTFGAYPVDMPDCSIDYLISSSNKCIEGIPGFSFVIARRSSLNTCRAQARTLSLDLYSQWTGLEGNGQFRFTPPVQSLMAFRTALLELEAEGGTEGRARRYAENNHILLEGMNAMGFRTYLPDHLRSYIITSFHYPDHPLFSFEKFYTLLNEKGFIIYPGKLSQVDCFRIGNIGQLYPDDIRQLLKAIEITLNEMNVTLK